MADNYDLDDEDLDMVDNEQDDIVEVLSSGRRAVSSGEPSLDGSIDVDEERGALSDSDITHAARTSTIASQVKGPSSEVLEESCRLEAAARDRGSEWEDILGSGQLMKMQMREGRGHHRPTDGQYVSIKVVDVLRGVDSHERLTFILGFSMVIDAWELVVKLMTEGEVVGVRTKARLAYGELGLDETIPPNQDQEYTIELLEIGHSPKYTAMSDTELSEFVLAAKERGNFYFNRGEYEKAIFVYKRASGIVEVPEENEPIRKLFSALHSNLAVCYSKLNEWEEVLSCTNESLRLHSGNTKALFRQAAAHAARKDVELAIDCLNKALVIDPDDPAIINELERLSGLRRRRRQEERLLYKKMLAGAGADDPPAPHWLRANGQRAAITAFFVVMFGLFIYSLLRMYERAL